MPSSRHTEAGCDRAVSWLRRAKRNDPLKLRLLDSQVARELGIVVSDLASRARPDQGAEEGRRLDVGTRQGGETLLDAPTRPAARCAAYNAAEHVAPISPSAPRRKSFKRP
jgi:hypothetical protein